MGSGASSLGQSASGTLPLLAKDGNKIEVTRLLSQKGVKVNEIERDTGNTALHYAAAIGHVSSALRVLTPALVIRARSAEQVNGMSKYIKERVRFL
eukprot:5808377-Pyramimonas_sp.AAC.1